MNNIKMRHLILMVLGLLMTACNQNWNPGSQQGANLGTPEYCSVFPMDPICSGGGTSLALFQFVFTTPSTDGALRLQHLDPANPQLGTGVASIQILNGSDVAIMGTIAFNATSAPAQVTSIALCSAASATATACSGPASSSGSFSVNAKQNQYFHLKVQADGTITFVPEVNAITLNLTATDATYNKSIKVPIVN